MTCTNTIHTHKPPPCNYPALSLSPSISALTLCQNQPYCVHPHPPLPTKAVCDDCRAWAPNIMAPSIASAVAASFYAELTNINWLNRWNGLMVGQIRRKTERTGKEKREEGKSQQTWKGEPKMSRKKSNPKQNGNWTVLAFRYSLLTVKFFHNPEPI